MFRSILFLVVSLSSLGLSLATADEVHPVTAEVKKQLGDRSPDRQFMLLVTLKIKPDTESSLIEAMRLATIETRKEDGNFRYQLLADPTDPLTFQLSEHWKTVDALDAHLKTPYLVKLQEQLDSILSEPPGLAVMTPVNLKLPKKSD